MKKILISILTILGVGLSFCSAEYTFNAFESRGIYDSSLQLLDSNFYFNITNSNLNSSCNNSYPWNGYMVVNFTGFSDSLILKDFCIRFRYDFINRLFVYNNNTNYTNGFQSGNLMCWNNLNIDLSSNNYSLQYLISSSNNKNWNYHLDNGYTDFNTICYYPYTYYNNDSLSLDNYYLSLGGNRFVNFDFSNMNKRYNYYVPVPISFTIDFPSNPKFKVNYGNTSYEYELEDNLFIHLKSPTTQNGNTFIYAGSTGLNLFYNGTSQWYDKSNLYLESMFWYNNNIFTPICL